MSIVEQEGCLSQEMQENLTLLTDLMEIGQVELRKDSTGKLHIKYKTESGTERGQNSTEVRTQVEEFVQTTRAVKRAKGAPLGVVLDKSKIGTGPLGRYTEGRQFEETQEVLGKGKYAGDVKVVRDKKSNTEHALKTVKMSEFSGNEVLAWVDLGDSDTFPNLYMVRLDNNNVAFHMEIIKHGVILDGIINSHMTNLLQNAPELMRPFALCIYHALLGAVAEMHDKNWAHCDLHGKNVLITQDAMKVHVVDFGLARPLREGANYDHHALKDDILKALRLFCGMYTGEDFLDIYALERRIKDGTLMKEVLSKTPHLSASEKKELHQLITKTYAVLRDPNMAGYGSTESLREEIEEKLYSGYTEKMTDVLKKASAILFPDFHNRARDINLQGEQEEAVGGAVAGKEGGEATPDPTQTETALEEDISSVMQVLVFPPEV